MSVRLNENHYASASAFQPELLAISFYYPPANNPRAVQVARLLRHTRLGTSLVCAAYLDSADRRDELLVTESERSLQNIYRVPFRVSPLERKITALVRRVARPFWDEWPDNSRAWKDTVVSFLTTKFQQEQIMPKAMITFGSPMSDHLIGLELKRLYKLPWLAHFSDPWVDNPFKNYGWLTGKANLKMERQVVESADRLLFTSEETIDLVMSKYPDELRNNCRVLTHSYEGNKYKFRKSTGQEVIIRFLGDLYGPRTPRPLFAALALIQREEPKSLENLKFEFVGSMCELNVWEMGLRELPANLVVLRDTVPNSASLELMSEADGLLVIDAPADMSPFLPSKLVDYMGAGRPVLGITPPGTASRLIKSLGGWVGNPADLRQVKDALLEFIRTLRDLRTKEQHMWGESAVRLRFDANSVGEEFRDLVMELVHSNGAPTIGLDS